MNNIGIYRKQLSMTYQALADACGMSKSYIYELENDKKSSPTIYRAYKVAAVLGCSVYDLFPDTTEIEEETIIVRRVK